MKINRFINELYIRDTLSLTSRDRLNLIDIAETCYIQGSFSKTKFYMYVEKNKEISFDFATNEKK